VGGNTRGKIHGRGSWGAWGILIKARSEATSKGVASLARERDVFRRLKQKVPSKIGRVRSIFLGIHPVWIQERQVGQDCPRPCGIRNATSWRRRGYKKSKGGWLETLEQHDKFFPSWETLLDFNPARSWYYKAEGCSWNISGLQYPWPMCPRRMSLLWQGVCCIC